MCLHGVYMYTDTHELPREMKELRLRVCTCVRVYIHTYTHTGRLIYIVNCEETYIYSQLTNIYSQLTNIYSQLQSPSMWRIKTNLKGYI